MKKLFLSLAVVAAMFGLTNCSKQQASTSVAPTATEVSTENEAMSVVYAGFPETFNTGTKAAYATASVTLPTGSWELNNALIGNTTSDRKNGAQSVRIQTTGLLTMMFNVTNGASQVTVAHAIYGTDASSTWNLQYSTNNGSTWTTTGSTITTSSTTLSTATFTMTLTGNVRFRIQKLTGGRLNIDDFSISDNSGTGGGGSDTVATRDNNMAMGNPSGATSVSSNMNNYLVVKSQYALSYNNSRGIANWVSWHLSTAWKGSAVRCDCFTQDATLPTGFFRASTSNYTGTGFDRGHLCPSDDRDGSDTDNAATFKMTNIAPQSPILNQQTWGDLETYCRTLITQGKELYIIAGSYGTGGTGSNGGTTSTIASGSITVPNRFYKIIVVLSKGINDVGRVTTSTRVIAVNMPNLQTVNSQTWGYYRVSVDAIEAATGYDFLSNVPTSIQSVIEASVDNGATN